MTTLLVRTSLLTKQIPRNTNVLLLSHPFSEKPKTETVKENPLYVQEYPYRAVNRGETKDAIPHKTSATETMTPWKGWWGTFVKEKMPFLLWKPDDIHDLNQQPNPMTKVPISRDDPTKTAMFRYPSPGSQPAVRQPTLDDDDDDPYNTAYYPKDTKRRYTGDPANLNPELEHIKLLLLKKDDGTEEDPRLLKAIEQLEQGPESSPGNKGMFATGKSDFDETGLRASMSANNKAYNESLDRHMPDHLPTPEWANRWEEEVAWYEERGLHVPLGASGGCVVAREDRIARW